MMFKALSLNRLLASSRTNLPFIKTTISRLTYPLQQRPLYTFSSGDRMPRNKQQAWMMQQQKNMSSSPQSDEQTKSYEGVSKVGISGFFVLLGGLIYIVYNADVKSKEQMDYFQQQIKGLLQVKQRESLVGGDWTLFNSQGEAFSSQMLSGYYYLVYFGYTNCPDMSPNTLFYLSSIYRIIRNLPEGAYLKLKIVFISLDPQRDTPQSMKEYLKNFSKNIIGVTASAPNDPQLKQVLKKFKIQTQKVSGIKGTEDSKYLIDHSRRVFLMDPQNKYLYHLNLDYSQQQSAKAILAKIVQNEYRKTNIQNQMGNSS